MEALIGCPPLSRNGRLKDFDFSQSMLPSCSSLSHPIDWVRVAVPAGAGAVRTVGFVVKVQAPGGLR